MWKAENPLMLREQQHDHIMLDTPIGLISWKVIRRGLQSVHREQVRREEVTAKRRAAAFKGVETKRRKKEQNADNNK